MNMKKWLSLLLAALMLMSMATAFADVADTTIPEEEFSNYIMLLASDGSITVNAAVEGQTYKAYKIFNAAFDANNANNVAYTIYETDPWFNDLKNDTTYFTFTQVGDTGMYVVTAKSNDAAGLAAFLYTKLEGKTETATLTKDPDTGTVSTTGLDYGYYFITSTLGSLCALTTTNPDAVITEKNEAPEIEKKVLEDSNSAWQDHNDADIKQDVDFKATITVKKGAENYTLHDEMSTGLTLKADSIKVTVSDTEVKAIDGENTNFTITTTGLTDGCTFEIAFTNEYISTLAADTEIEVTYTATVNESAVVGLPGNPNKVKLEYGDNATPNYTPTQETITYTWDMDVLKYADGNEQNVLVGVKFILLNNDKSKVANVQNGKLVSWDAMPTQGEGESDEAFAARLDAFIESHKLTTNANGKIEIDGLDADTYYLRETDALPGYNPLTTDQAVEIKGATVEQNTLTYTTKVVKINNNKGTSLPSTGGMGTTILYAVGGVLVLAAFVLIVTKRRASEN